MVLLESNLGFQHMHKLLERAGSRASVPPEGAHSALKELVARRWAADGCEEAEDRAKLLSLIDMFVPFLALERPHIQARLPGASPAPPLPAAFVRELLWPTPLGLVCREEACTGSVPGPGPHAGLMRMCGRGAARLSTAAAVA